MGEKMNSKRVLLQRVVIGMVVTASLGVVNSGLQSASGATDPLAPKPLKEMVTLTVAASPGESKADLFLAGPLGEFAKENLTVEITSTTSANQIPLPGG